LFLLAVTPIALSKEQALLARVTVYWASGGSGSDGWTRQHIAASGARLRAGHCAVDPRRIPYGSHVILPDGALVAVDTGSAVRSRRAARLCGRSTLERNAIVIDRFFETKGQAMAWANRNPQFMTVRVQSPNELSTSVTTVKSNTGIIANNSRTSTTPSAMSKASSTQRLVSTTPLQPAALSRNTVAKAPIPKLIASNAPRSATTPSLLNEPQQKLLAQYTRQPRSRYGRSVAYLP